MSLPPKAQQEYDELGLPVEYLPNIATDAQEKFYIKAANQHHQLVAENERLSDENKRLLKMAGYITNYGEESGWSRVLQVISMTLSGNDFNPMREDETP